MGDHFVLLVDRLLTESTLEAAIGSIDSLSATTDDKVAIDIPSDTNYGDNSLSPRKIVECRICQDDDVDSNMEVPCSCSGTLKYAHRKCIQKWCNEKGDTMCEICHQQFKPGYTAPPPIFRLGGVTMNLRGHWQVSGRDMNNPRIIAMVSTDHSLLDTEYDRYVVSTSRSILCCRALAILFMILLIFRHTLPIIVNRAGSFSFPLIMLVMLRIAGIILPVFIILRALTCIVSRYHQAHASSNGEGSRFTLRQSHHVIAIP